MQLLLLYVCMYVCMYVCVLLMYLERGWSGVPENTSSHVMLYVCMYVCMYARNTFSSVLCVVWWVREKAKER